MLYSLCRNQCFCKDKINKGRLQIRNVKIVKNDNAGGLKALSTQ